MARHLNGTAEKQQFFSQSGFARVWMRDDSEGAPPGDLLGNRGQDLNSAFVGSALAYCTASRPESCPLAQAVAVSA